MPKVNDEELKQAQKDLANNLEAQWLMKQVIEENEGELIALEIQEMAIRELIYNLDDSAEQPEEASSTQESENFEFDFEFDDRNIH